MSYTAPAVSFVGSANVATTIGWSVTVSGVSFGALDTTPSSRVGLSSCVTASWASATSVVCLPAGGQGVSHDAILTSVAVAGTQTRVFSYDGALLACGLCASMVLRNGLAKFGLGSLFNERYTVWFYSLARQSIADCS